MVLPKVIQPSENSYLLEADEATGSSYIGPLLSCLPFTLTQEMLVPFRPYSPIALNLSCTILALSDKME